MNLMVCVLVCDGARQKQGKDVNKQEKPFWEKAGYTLFSFAACRALSDQAIDDD